MECFLLLSLICAHNRKIDSKLLIPSVQQFPKKCASKILFWGLVITKVRGKSEEFRVAKQNYLAEQIMDNFFSVGRINHPIPPLPPHQS